MTGRPYDAPPPVDAPDDARVTVRWDDALERDGEMLVMVGDDVTLLGPLAAEAARFASSGDEGGTTIGALEVHLLAVFGAPAHRDSAIAVREVVAALLERGVATLG